MRYALFFLAATAVIAFTGCASGPYQAPNPKFDDCAGECAQVHNRCMLNATSVEEVTRCNTQQETCVNRCESQNPRYILKERG